MSFFSNLSPGGFFSPLFSLWTHFTVD